MFNMANEHVHFFIDLCRIIHVDKILKTSAKELEMYVAFVRCNVGFFGN
jgi:hypothetical protein